jgi:hypothetical protein
VAGRRLSTELRAPAAARACTCGACGAAAFSGAAAPVSAPGAIARGLHLSLNIYYKDFKVTSTFPSAPYTRNVSEGLYGSNDPPPPLPLVLSGHTASLTPY